jgi:ABC-type lipoprotein export system ATPase subunit
MDIKLLPFFCPPFNLEPKINFFRQTIPVGQKQVAISRGLASGARVILADEPTGNLDKANGENVIEILRQLAHQQRYCVVVVIHNLEIAERSDKVWSMSDGVLTEQVALPV